jgi:hypothetical protein
VILFTWLEEEAALIKQMRQKNFPEVNVNSVSTLVPSEKGCLCFNKTKDVMIEGNNHLFCE